MANIKPLLSASFCDREGSSLSICQDHAIEMSAETEFQEAMTTLHQHMGIALGSDYQIHLTERYVSITVLDAKGNTKSKAVQLKKNEKGAWSNIDERQQKQLTASVQIVFKRIQEQALACQKHSSKSKNEPAPSSSVSNNNNHPRIEPTSSQKSEGQQEAIKQIPQQPDTPLTMQQQTQSNSAVKQNDKSEPKKDDSSLILQPISKKRGEEEELLLPSIPRQSTTTPPTHNTSPDTIVESSTRSTTDNSESVIAPKESPTTVVDSSKLLHTETTSPTKGMTNQPTTTITASTVSATPIEKPKYINPLHLFQIQAPKVTQPQNSSNTPNYDAIEELSTEERQRFNSLIKDDKAPSKPLGTTSMDDSDDLSSEEKRRLEKKNTQTNNNSYPFLGQLVDAFQNVNMDNFNSLQN